MMKPNLFYFVHAHGNGHRATFRLLFPELSEFFSVIAITTNSEITEHLRENYDVTVIELPPKYSANYEIPEHTFSKAFEVTPYGVEPARRAEAFAKAIIQFKPVAFYCDGVPELAISARSMGVPVVLVHLHGNIENDPTQVFAHHLADHIVAHFPDFAEQEDFQFIGKTYYAGYLSKYAETSSEDATDPDETITILLGYDNCSPEILQKITADQRYQFKIIGNKELYDLGPNCLQVGIVQDIKSAISGKVVISAAGQNSIAELLSLRKSIILLPEERPYREQTIHAEVLAKNNIVLLANEQFSSEQWSKTISRAAGIMMGPEELTDPESAKKLAIKMREWYG